MANIGTILSKLKSIPEEKQKEIKQFLALSDSGNTGFVPYESFRYGANTEFALESPKQVCRACTFLKHQKEFSHPLVQSILLHRLHVSMFSLIHTSENSIFSMDFLSDTTPCYEQLNARVSLQVSVGRYGRSAVRA